MKQAALEEAPNCIIHPAAMKIKTGEVIGSP